MKNDTKIHEQVEAARKSIDAQLTQKLIPKRFVPDIPPDMQSKNVQYVFDSSDSFNLTFDELIEIVGKARKAGNYVPVMGTVE